ncbi:hypothetical protein GGR53DRAFT_461753 [Hypoxylon sp. FL1150]|nr:hypothetical protein GGR53DRAFT_461753 [Hypoxylon sp. FL1150]
MANGKMEAVDTRPDNSPYNGSCVIFNTEDGTGAFHVHKALLDTHAKLSSYFERSLYFKLNASIECTHVLAHYLFTGTYQCLKPKGVTPNEKTAAEFATCLRVYMLAQEHELPGLGELAKGEMERLGRDLPATQLLDLASDARLTPAAGDTWFHGYIKSLLEPLMDMDGLPEHAGETFSFASVVLRTAVELWREKKGAVSTDRCPPGVGQGQESPVVIPPETAAACEPEIAAAFEPETAAACGPEIAAACEIETAAACEPEIAAACEIETAAACEPETEVGGGFTAPKKMNKGKKPKKSEQKKKTKKTKEKELRNFEEKTVLEELKTMKEAEWLAARQPASTPVRRLPEARGVQSGKSSNNAIGSILSSGNQPKQAGKTVLETGIFSGWPDRSAFTFGDNNSTSTFSQSSFNTPSSSGRSGNAKHSSPASGVHRGMGKVPTTLGATLCYANYATSDSPFSASILSFEHICAHPKLEGFPPEELQWKDYLSLSVKAQDVVNRRFIQTTLDDQSWSKARRSR